MCVSVLGRERSDGGCVCSKGACKTLERMHLRNFVLHGQNANRVREREGASEKESKRGGGGGVRGRRDYRHACMFMHACRQTDRQIITRLKSDFWCADHWLRPPGGEKILPECLSNCRC